MAKAPSVDMMDIWRSGEPKIIITVRRNKELRFRLWIADYLIRLAAWVACVGLEYDDDEGIEA